MMDIGRSVNPSLDIGQVCCPGRKLIKTHSFITLLWGNLGYFSTVYLLLRQIEGGFMQGLGLYTLEELKFSPSGLLYTRGPSQYKIPAVCDVPLRFNVYLLPDSHNPHAIYSSKVRPQSEVLIQKNSCCRELAATRSNLKRPAWLSCSSGHWRTHRLPGQLCVLRHQRRRGGCPL